MSTLRHENPPRGWLCTRDHIVGPCALVPRWWNLPDRLKFAGW